MRYAGRSDAAWLHMVRNMKIKRRYIVAAICCLLVILAAVCSLLLFTGATPRKAVIKIPEGVTDSQLMDTLAEYYGREYAGKVMSAAGFFGIDLKSRPGRYEVPSGTSGIMLLARLRSGRQTPVRFTVNNLRTRADITRSVASHFAFTASQLDSVLSDSVLMDRYGLSPENAGAIFLNNTFEAWWTDSPRRVLERIGKAYDRFWNDSRRAKARRLGLSPAEVITVASIAEEESAHADERGRIGRLYINRLARNMRLQADPTVRFAMNDFTVRRVGRQMLMADSPYNTYRVSGLPPGPIRTVEPATVDAVLDSEPSDDIYMCAKADFSGYHHFSSDYSEHRQHALEYRRALDARGIH